MTKFEPATHHAMENSAATRRRVRWSARPGNNSPGSGRRELLAGRGLTFWLQWLAAAFVITALLFALVIDKNRDIAVQYCVLATEALYKMVRRVELGLKILIKSPFTLLCNEVY